VSEDIWRGHFSLSEFNLAEGLRSFEHTLALCSLEEEGCGMGSALSSLKVAATWKEEVDRKGLSAAHLRADLINLPCNISFKTSSFVDIAISMQLLVAFDYRYIH